MIWPPDSRGLRLCPTPRQLRLSKTVAEESSGASPGGRARQRESAYARAHEDSATQTKRMGALLSKVSEADAWERMPWRAWKSPVEQAHVLPTFVLCEWAYRALALGTLEHARRTGALPLWFSAWMCGTANGTQGWDTLAKDD